MAGADRLDTAGCLIPVHSKKLLQSARSAAAQTVEKPIQAKVLEGGKASQSLRPQAQRRWESFSPAACTSAKIPLGSQTCEGRALRALQRAAAFSNESPVKRVSFESVSKRLFRHAPGRPAARRAVRQTVEKHAQPKVAEGRKASQSLRSQAQRK